MDAIVGLLLLLEIFSAELARVEAVGSKRNGRGDRDGVVVGDETNHIFDN